MCNYLLKTWSFNSLIHITRILRTRVLSAHVQVLILIQQIRFFRRKRRDVPCNLRFLFDKFVAFRRSLFVALINNCLQNPEFISQNGSSLFNEQTLQFACSAFNCVNYAFN